MMEPQELEHLRGSQRLTNVLLLVCVALLIVQMIGNYDRFMVSLLIIIPFLIYVFVRVGRWMTMRFTVDDWDEPIF